MSHDLLINIAALPTLWSALRFTALPLAWSRAAAERIWPPWCVQFWSMTKIPFISFNLFIHYSSINSLIFIRLELLTKSDNAVLYRPELTKPTAPSSLSPLSAPPSAASALCAAAAAAGTTASLASCPSSWTSRWPSSPSLSSPAPVVMASAWALTGSWSFPAPPLAPSAWWSERPIARLKCHKLKSLFLEMRNQILIRVVIARSIF